MKSNKTLSSTVLYSCIGAEISVELKSDVRVTGILDDCDQDMNLVLGKCRSEFVEASSTRKAIPNAELMFINGRNIRFVDLDNANIDETMKNTWLQRQRHTKRRHFIVDRHKPDSKKPRETT